ncbi:MAG: hypothetical protein LUF00_01640 [Lachnospiraceae bacterium]|nr:hypothetical protein [Lachnospiraceae bacterium]
MVYEGYYFNPSYAGFREGAISYCLDGYQVPLRRPLMVREGKAWMSGADLSDLLSVFPAVEKRKLNHSEYVPAQDILEGMCYRMQPYGNHLLLPIEPSFPGCREDEIAEILAQVQGECGDFRGVYWHVGLQRWAPYRIYLPRSYGEGKMNPLIVGLHGGGGSPDSFFTHSRDAVKEYAERDGYILLAPDASTRNSSYGCALPPFGMEHAVLDPSCAENPAHLTENELQWVHMGEIGLTQIMEEVCETYFVDEKRIFLMGNSMGGMGTLYYAARYPEKFCKISPAGALPDMTFFDDSALRSTPVLFVAGEKDVHGVKWMREGCRKMQEDGIPLKYREVEGGTHGSAWVDVLDEIFDFFRD